MKRKLLALVCAATMVLGMSFTVCAAGSAGAADIVPEGPTIQGNLNVDVQGTELTAENIASFKDTASVEGVEQEAGLTVKVDPIAAGQDVKALGNGIADATAKFAADYAKSIGYNFGNVGGTYSINSVFDLNVKAETAAETYTVSVKVEGITEGTNVYAVHQLASGKYEILPCTVNGDIVTFTVTGTSPVAIITLGVDIEVTPAGDPGTSTDSGEAATTPSASTSPKTGDPLFAVEAMAALCGAVACYAGKKRK